MIIINFKTYDQATGNKAYNLAKKIIKVSDKKVMLAVQATDLYRLSKLKVDLLAQHVSPLNNGTNTGFVLPKAIKKSGAKGTLLNHAEHKMNFFQLKKAIKICKQFKLKTVVCVPNLIKAKKLKILKPDYMAYEDPKLISTGKSITELNPKKVKNFVKILSDTKIIPLCGAGISNKKDIEKALDLGTKGVLVASAIVKAKNPEVILKRFLGVFK